MSFFIAVKIQYKKYFYTVLKGAHVQSGSGIVFDREMKRRSLASPTLHSTGRSFFTKKKKKLWSHMI
jgi:hypothetical protein